MSLAPAASRILNHSPQLFPVFAVSAASPILSFAKPPMCSPHSLLCASPTRSSKGAENPHTGCKPEGRNEKDRASPCLRFLISARECALRFRSDHPPVFLCAPLRPSTPNGTGQDLRTGKSRGPAFRGSSVWLVW